MKIFFMIGWRNLWRNKRRSLIVIFSIALGIFAMLLSMGLMNGMNNQMVENTISTSLGHISIHRKGFQDDMKLQNNFLFSKSLENALTDTPSYAPRIKLEGMIRSSEASRGVLIVGIHPEKEKSVTQIYDYTLRQGKSTYLNDSKAKDILISKSLAEKLELLIGDRVVLMFQDIQKDMTGVAFRIKGLYQSPVESFDRFVVFVGLDALAKLTGMGEKISEIIIRTEHRNQVDVMAKHIHSHAKAWIKEEHIEVLTWKEMAPNLLRAIRLFDSMMYIFFSIIFITVVFSIANTLVMAIMERFHEIGLMKCIGTKPSRIGAMVLFEAINLGLVGLMTGILAAGGLIGFLSVTGIDFSFYSESMRTLGTGTIIYPALKPMDIIVCALIVLGTTLIAALYPAIKAIRIKPLDALHHI